MRSNRCRVGLRIDLSIATTPDLAVCHARLFQFGQDMVGVVRSLRGIPAKYTQGRYKAMRKLREVMDPPTLSGPQLTNPARGWKAPNTFAINFKKETAVSKMVIDFSPEGTAQAQHRDSFPLSFLGPQHIERASDIRFNEDTQKWDMYVRANDEFILPVGGGGFEGYDEARRVEVQWLDACRLYNLDVFSQKGSVLLMELRKQCPTSPQIRTPEPLST